MMQDQPGEQLLLSLQLKKTSEYETMTRTGVQAHARRPPAEFLCVRGLLGAETPQSHDIMSGGRR
jgi:hypothetical protein